MEDNLEEQVSSSTVNTTDEKDFVTNKKEPTLHEPLDCTRVATLELEFSSSRVNPGDFNETVNLIKFQDSSVSWSLGVRWDEEDEDEEDSRLSLVLSDVSADKALCVKLEAVVTTSAKSRAPPVTTTLTKLFNADGEIIVVKDMSKVRNASFVAKVSTYYRGNRCAVCADWSALRHRQDLSDVVFLARGEQLSAHKQVLCARSPVLDRMLTTEAEENQMKRQKQKQINVDDTSAAALAKFLEFVYSGHVRDFEGLEREVLVAADRYKVEALKLLCQSEMSRQVDVSNVLETLVFAESLKASLLKQAALAVAVDKMTIVMASDTWKDFHRQHNDLVEDLLKEAVLSTTRV